MVLRTCQGRKFSDICFTWVICPSSTSARVHTRPRWSGSSTTTTPTSSPRKPRNNYPSSTRSPRRCPPWCPGGPQLRWLRSLPLRCQRSLSPLSPRSKRGPWPSTSSPTSPPRYTTPQRCLSLSGFLGPGSSATSWRRRTTQHEGRPCRVSRLRAEIDVWSQR